MKILFAFLFVMVVIIELSAHLLGTGLNIYSKPLLMPLLLAYFIASYGLRLDRNLLLVALALLLSTAGDVCLMGTSSMHFMAGLSFFLVAHITYICIFVGSGGDGHTRFGWSWKLVVPMATYVAILLFLLLPGSGPMQLPILIYGMAIFTMWYTALVYFGAGTAPKNWAVMIGASLFVLSDSLIGVNKFYVELPLSGFLIMLTYISGQFLIVHGLLRRLKPSASSGRNLQSSQA